jgi:ABC-type nitrate/sulfonate/bicarbonate transport system substrate-binding protein
MAIDNGRRVRGWKLLPVSALALLAAAVIACSAAAPAATPVPAATPHKSGTIRFSDTGPEMVKDLPWRMALDALKEQGYTIEVTQFASSSLVPAALVSGDIDVASINTNLTWTAVAKGAEIRTVVGKIGPSFYLVTESEINACQELDGKRLGFSTRQAVGYVMFQQTLDKECPGTTPQILLVGNTTSRLAALQKGEIDGAYLEAEDWMELDRQSAGKYHILMDFPREYPGFPLSAFSVRTEWAEQHQEMVDDFIRALLDQTRRIVSDPSLLSTQISTRFAIDPGEAQELAEAYLGLGIWDVNGGLTPENLRQSLDFLTTNGSVPQGLSVSEIADLSYLDSVLDQIGRR